MHLETLQERLAEWDLFVPTKNANENSLMESLASFYYDDAGEARLVRNACVGWLRNHRTFVPRDAVLSLGYATHSPQRVCH